MRLLPRLVVLAFLLGPPALAAPIPPGCEEDAIACKEDCTIEYGGNSSAIRKLTRCFEGCTNQRSQCARKFNAVNGRAADAPEAAPERRQSKTEAAKLREIEEKDRKRDEDPFGDDDKPVRERPARDAYDDPPEPPPERKAYRASDEPEKKPVRGNTRPPATVPARATEPAPERTPPPPSPAVAPEPAPERTRSDAPDIEAFAEPPPRDEPPAPRPAPKPVVAEPAPSRDTSDDDLPAPLPPVERKAPPPRPVEAPRPKPPPEPKKDISDWDPNGD